MRMRWWLHTGVVSLLALLAVVIFKVSSQPLSDEQLRDVQGRESIFVMPEPTLSTDVLTQALMRFFDGRVFALDLSAESFQSAWLQAAGTTLEASLYDGRGVTQLMVVGPPVGLHLLGESGAATSGWPLQRRQCGRVVHQPPGHERGPHLGLESLSVDTQLHHAVHGGGDPWAPERFGGLSGQPIALRYAA